VELDREIFNVETDKFHTLALTVEGAVYSFGNGIHGRLGFGNVDDVVEPTLLRFPKEAKRIVQIAVSENHSLALTDEGYIYTWGCNRYR
jgi:alpha-tubulin suppressor-like RCC1 family protein